MEEKKISAIGKHIWVIRDEPEQEKEGLFIPDSAVEKPNTGLIVDIEASSLDSKRLKSGVQKRAVFNKASGQIIDFMGQEYVVLREDQILAIL